MNESSTEIRRTPLPPNSSTPVSTSLIGLQDAFLLLQFPQLLAMQHTALSMPGSVTADLGSTQLLALLTTKTQGQEEGSLPLGLNI